MMGQDSDSGQPRRITDPWLPAITRDIVRCELGIRGRCELMAAMR